MRVAGFFGVAFVIGVTPDGVTVTGTAWLRARAIYGPGSPGAKLASMYLKRMISAEMMSLVLSTVIRAATRQIAVTTGDFIAILQWVSE